MYHVYIESTDKKVAYFIHLSRVELDDLLDQEERYGELTVTVVN